MGLTQQRERDTKSAMSTSESTAQERPAPPVKITERDARFELVELDPTLVRLFRTPGGTVRVTITDTQTGSERSFLRVRIARAFPFTRPDSYIGLRDGGDGEIGILATLDGLDPESRAIIDEELTRRYFIPRVIRVLDIREERGGMFFFSVETDKGNREFVIQGPRDSCQNLSANRMLVTDKDGLRYEFPDLSTLDAKTLAFFDRVG
ncbi:MAG: hypothetical protein OHK0029_11910 [Armatimonadaceae bacterium]